MMYRLSENVNLQQSSIDLGNYRESMRNYYIKLHHVVVQKRKRKQPHTCISKKNTQMHVPPLNWTEFESAFFFLWNLIFYIITKVFYKQKPKKKKDPGLPTRPNYNTRKPNTGPYPLTNRWRKTTCSTQEKKETRAKTISPSSSTCESSLQLNQKPPETTGITPETRATIDFTDLKVVIETNRSL